MRLLTEHGVEYSQPTPHALALPNSTALGQVPGLEGLTEVQDLSSQRTLDRVEAMSGESWWDACAGAGGKSLLLLDRFPGLRLLVSDVRSSILKNLDARFSTPGANGYRRKVVGLTRDTAPVLGDEQFDGIIVDAPCTGSGTWGRTPEMMTFFGGRDMIDKFLILQRSIVKGVVRHLKPGKPLVYITCSVFADENEGMVDYIRHEFGLQLSSSEYLKGYEEKADTLFVAVFIKQE